MVFSFHSHINPDKGPERCLILFRQDYSCQSVRDAASFQGALDRRCVARCEQKSGRVMRVIFTELTIPLATC